MRIDRMFPLFFTYSDMFRDSLNLRGTRHLHVHYPTEMWGSGYCTMPAVPLVGSKQCDLPSYGCIFVHYTLAASFV
jgi:hypothetical protein